MTDARIQKLAENLINYSCNLQKGEKLLIEANGIDIAMINALVEKAYAKQAFPFVEISDSRVKRQILLGINRETAELMAKYDGFRMKEMDAYIGLRGGLNSMELSDVPAEKMQLYGKYYSHPVHHELRVKGTKWVVLRWPTPAMAQLANMSTQAFEDFYFSVCNLDYALMSKAMDPLIELIDKTDKVRIIAKNTDLTFSIKGMKGIKCSGERNIPDGEIYTAPVKDSVNGYIAYNTPSIENGIMFNNVKLWFKDGKIVKAQADKTEQLNKILDIDEGARYIGEFALGVNPFITKPIGDILFDEKISGSIHFTPGSCYEDCDNGNQSAVHWDLVQMHTPEYGGGEIYFDDTLVRKDGRFVLADLEGLNPENLK
ncbi:MAG: aminopeptidase [Christensenellales bacterium]|jgi:aminopeptidase|nr:aminopeptidase [Clostridiales bacterium]